MNIYNEINRISTTSWKRLLLEIYAEKKDCFTALQNYITTEEDRYKGELLLFQPSNIFNAFNYFEIPETKVVILGQDCYHGKGQAMGLSFSVPPEAKIPPSLRNIYKELKSEYPSYNYSNGDLSHWAHDGVLLLNAALTVRESIPGSHLKYWIPITNLIIEKLSQQTTEVVFMLWGNFAKSKRRFIDTTNGHHILESAHPSPLSANRGGWFGNSHFIKANDFLEFVGKSTVSW